MVLSLIVIIIILKKIIIARNIYVSKILNKK